MASSTNTIDALIDAVETVITADIAAKLAVQNTAKVQRGWAMAKPAKFWRATLLGKPLSVTPTVAIYAEDEVHATNILADDYHVEVGIVVELLLRRSDIAPNLEDELDLVRGFERYGVAMMRALEEDCRDGSGTLRGVGVWSFERRTTRFDATQFGINVEAGGTYRWGRYRARFKQQTAQV